MCFFIGHGICENISAVAKWSSYYNVILALHEPIQITYYISLFIVAVFVVFCAIWFGFYLSKTIIAPIMKMADGTKRIADGDLTFRIVETVYDDEIVGIVDSFNKMTADLFVS